MTENDDEMLAVALVLVPRTDHERQAVAWNATLRGADARLPGGKGRPGHTIVLGASGDDARPHLTLAMGARARRDLPTMTEVLRDIAKGEKVVEASKGSIINRCNRSGGSVVWLAFSREPVILAWHERAMQILGDETVEKTRRLLFHDDEHVADRARSYVTNFRDRTSGRYFEPHVTLGYGNLDETLASPSPFVFDRVALAHIGPHCTMYIRQALPLAQDQRPR